MTIGEKVRYLRKIHGWSQKELSQKLGSGNAASVSALERSASVRRVTIAKLSKAFEISETELLEGTDMEMVSGPPRVQMQPSRAGKERDMEKVRLQLVSQVLQLSDTKLDMASRYLSSMMEE